MASTRSLCAALLAIVILGLLAACGAPGGGGSEQGGDDSGTSAGSTTSDGSDGGTSAQGSEPPPEEPVTSLETCGSCHAPWQALPVTDVAAEGDAHFVDPDPNGPLTPSGYRRIDAVITAVDLTGAQVVIDFQATSESAAPVDVLFPEDGRFAIARLEDGIDGEPNDWVNLGTSLAERFTSGLFQSLGGGSYRYRSALDPTGIVAPGDSIRIAIQLSASDLPSENAWCDFDADLTAPNACTGTTLTRDILQTADCNVCHGPTPDTKLVFHGGRSDLEYCVTCHNPTGATDMSLLVHKIHAGEYLANGFREWSEVRFTKDLDRCQVCHTGAGVDVDNWKEVPQRNACGSCHDQVDFATGQNHGSGGVQTTDRFCSGCHPPDGPVTQIQIPVTTVHRGQRRFLEAQRYRGGVNGFDIESLAFSAAADEISVVYSVTRDGTRMALETAPEWTAGGRLSLVLGWNTEEYGNPGSGATPAQPLQVDALDVGGAVTALGGGLYQAVLTRPSQATGSLTVHLEGRPVEDPAAPGSSGERIPVASVIETIGVESGGRSLTEARRSIVDPARCNGCHDAAGAGLAAHGSNRTGQTAVCAVCHNPDATDIDRRPADPADTPDGKREEAIDFKRIIHQIHAGSSLEEGLVLYGFSGTPNRYDSVDFTGSLENCETCHVQGSYSTVDALAAGNSTVDTAADLADPDDDLNISAAAAVCSSCHDAAQDESHMRRYGASFGALDANIR